MVAPLPRQKRSLTGRVRPRPGWRGKQVLQVEELTEWVEAYRAPPPPWSTQAQAAAWLARPDKVLSTRTIWRDAEWDDLVGMSLVIVPPSNPIPQPEPD